MFLLIFTTQAMAFELWPAPQTKTDYAWTMTKIAAFGATQFDIRTTSDAIRRGYIEGNPFTNAVIDRHDPAPWQRTAFVQAQTLGINLFFDQVYKGCGPSKPCKWIIIGCRGTFVVMSTKAGIHNINNK
jgi:hypothetical protein